MASRPPVHVDPDVGIPDLIRRLTDDSKRLARDEIQLAKLELSESVHTGTRGAVQMGLAFGVGVVAAVALTIALAALLGRLIGQNYWLGAMLVGLIELGLGFWLLRRGTTRLKQTTYTFPESREALRATAGWVRHPRAD